MLYLDHQAIPDKAGNTALAHFFYYTQSEFDFWKTQYYDIDNRHPSITLVNLGDYSTVRNPYFRMDWNEDVTGFEAGDVRVEGGSIASFNDDEDEDRKFGMRLTADREGSVTISVSANAAQDGHENESVAFSKTVTFDWTAPRVSSITRQNPTNRLTNSDTVTWRVTFGEPVRNVNAGDFTLSGASGALTVSEVQGSSGAQYDVTAKDGAMANFNGVISLGFHSDQNIADPAGNSLSDTTPTGANDNDYLLDNTPPRVISITRQDPTSVLSRATARETNGDAVTWRVSFNVPVRNVDARDFTLSNATGALTVAHAPGSSQTRWDVTAAGGNMENFNGVIALGFSPDRNISDAAGNVLSNTTPTGTNDNDYLLDNTPPTVAIEGVPATADDPFTAVLRFSEAVSGFEVGDIAATGVALSDFTASEAGRVWTVRATPGADYRLAVPAGVASDAAGNGNRANDGEGAQGLHVAAGAGLVAAPESLTIAEGSSETFTVALAAVPTGPVTVALSSDNGDVSLNPARLTFTTSDWNAPQTVTASAAADADAANESATLGLDPSGGGYDALADGSVAVTVTDRDARLKVAPVSLAIPEGSSDSFTVALAAVPTGPVTVALTSDNGDVTLDKAGLTFTTSDWSQARTVTVRAARDEDAGDDSASVGLALSGGGYDGVSGGSVSVVVSDGDAGLIVTPASLALAEGSSGSFTVSLAALPVGPVAVALSSDNGDVTLDRAALTFTPSDWDTPQTVTARAGRDGDAEDDSALLVLDPSGGGYDRLADGTLAVTVRDGDLSGAGLTVIPAVLTVPEGGTERFTAALATAPQGPVTVPVSSDHGAVTVSPAELTFTPSDWNVARTVTVSAAEDEDEEDENAMLGLDPSGGGYDGLTEGAVLVTVTDGDVAGAGLTLAPARLTIAEGSSASFTLALAALPKGRVTVAVSSDHGDVTVSPASLTFTPSDWNSAQTVTVSAAKDDDAANESATLTVDPSGGGYDDLADGSLPVTVTDTNPPVTGVAALPEAERRLAEPALVDVALDTLSGMSAALQGRFGGCDTAVTLGGETVRAGGAEARGRRTGERRPTPGEALGRSAFRWSAGCDGASDRRWTVWGHGDLAHFSGGLTQGRYEGALRTAWLGVDRYVRENLVAGAALSRGEGRIEFGRFSLADETAELLTRLTVGWPYLRVETRGGGALQLVLGAGRGAAEYRRVGQRTEKAKLEALLASIGGEAPLWRGGGVSLRARGGLEAAQVKTGGGASGVLGGLRAEGRRLRAGVEAEHSAFRLGTLALAPRGAAAVAQDAGDGLAGAGLELSAGLRIATSDPRFGFSASARWLALHSAERRRNWGGGVEAVWKAAPDGRGLSLSLAPTWGLQGEDALQGPDIFASLEERAGGGAALASRLGYGLAPPHGGLLTPFVELALGERDTRRLATGAEFEWRPDLAATLTGERRDAPNQPSDLRFGLQLHLKF